jgi:DNA-binding response OmpR family regulator
MVFGALNREVVGLTIPESVRRCFHGRPMGELDLRVLLSQITGGLVLLVITATGGTPARAAVVTQFDLDGGTVELNFGHLGEVGSAFERDGFLVLGQYQPLPHILTPLSFGPWTLSMFTSGSDGAPAPTAIVAGSNLTVDLRSLFVGLSGPWMHSHALNIGGLATGTLDLNTDDFLLSWTRDFVGSGIPFLRSGTFSLHGRAQREPVPVPAAIILFWSGLCGVVGVVLRRNGPLKRQDTGIGPGTVNGQQGGGIPILLVSSDRELASRLEEDICRSGYLPRVVSSVVSLCGDEHQIIPGLVLVDCRVKDWDMLRTDAKLSAVPMITVVPTGSEYGEDDIVSDLNRGADGVYSCQDGPRLLLAKIGAYLRRAEGGNSPRGVYRVGSIELDADAHEVRAGGESILLSAKPFAILKTFMSAPSKVFTRGELVNLVWGPGFAIGAHTLDVHVHTIRQQLERDPDRGCQLVSVKGVGFKLKALGPSEPFSAAKMDRDGVQSAAGSVARRDSTANQRQMKGQPQTFVPSLTSRQEGWLSQIQQRRSRQLGRRRSPRERHRPVLSR